MHATPLVVLSICDGWDANESIKSGIKQIMFVGIGPTSVHVMRQTKNNVMKKDESWHNLSTVRYFLSY